MPGGHIPGPLGLAAAGVAMLAREAHQGRRHAGGSQVIQQHRLCAVLKVAVVAVLECGSCVGVNQGQHIQSWGAPQSGERNAQ